MIRKTEYKLIIHVYHENVSPWTLNTGTKVAKFSTFTAILASCQFFFFLLWSPKWLQLRVLVIKSFQSLLFLIITMENNSDFAYTSSRQVTCNLWAYLKSCQLAWYEWLKHPTPYCCLGGGGFKSQHLKMVFSFLIKTDLRWEIVMCYLMFFVILDRWLCCHRWNSDDEW